MLLLQTLVRQPAILTDRDLLLKGIRAFTACIIDSYWLIVMMLNRCRLVKLQCANWARGQRTIKCRSAHLSPKIFVSEFHSQVSESTNCFPTYRGTRRQNKENASTEGMKLCEGRVG